VHALIGENGAGKSTLIKMIAGVYSPDEGAIFFRGREQRWSSPGEAKAAGIHVIYQELVLFPELSVCENIFIGNEPRNKLGLIDSRRSLEAAQEILGRLGHTLDPHAPVKSLTVADQQMVEIAKALVGDVRLLILDEPTAVISGREAELLFERVKRLRDRGVCVIYISHRIEEIFKLADRVTVLKDGQLVGTKTISAVDRNDLVTMMVGRRLADIYPPKRPKPRLPAVLKVSGIASAPRVKDVSFELRPGEVLGLAGLVGAGRSELAHAIFGSGRRDAGTVTLDGEDLPAENPAASIRKGIGFLTEDRKGEGLLMRLDVAANISAPRLDEVATGLFIDRARETQIAVDEIAKYRIIVPGPTVGVRNLSGGNQQKILFSRWSRACRKVLILDEPTRGVDIGAKVEIYSLVADLAAQGLAILVISSELPEILGLCDRVLVMREGRAVGELTGEAMTEERVMRLAALSPESEAA
jgi:ABC-type sugar transport system ATPase subunit